MERLFKLKEHNTDVRTEITAGITTFLSMVYILAVNPNILSAAGMNPSAVFTATAVSGAIATLFMAFLANYPVALASGMGLNAYFSYTVCAELAKAGIQDPWKVALAAIFVEGVVFILLSLVKFRETLVNNVPKNLKLGITAGIGLFISIVGLKGAGIIVASPATILELGNMKSPQVILALFGFLAIAVLSHFRVRGAILWGILMTWVLGMIAQSTGWYVVNPQVGANSLFPNFSSGIIPNMPHMFALDFSYIKGHLPKVGGALMSDALGTIVGALMGTSTVTSYVESSAGVAQGGRTGLTAVTVAVLFLASLFLSPIFLAIPGFATTPALLYVGFLMLSAVKEMDFGDGDMASAIGGFLAIIMMPFTYSIASGIMFGVLAYVIIKIATGKIKDIHMVMAISAVLFLIKILLMIFKG